MKLEPESQAMLDCAVAAGLPPVYTLPIKEARKRMNAALIPDIPEIGVHSVEEILIPGKVDLPARLYRASNSYENPGMVFFHGGGWGLNSISTHDHLCRELCRIAGINVISVEYRLAPEHKFPAQIDDAIQATAWVFNNAASLGMKSDLIGVGGDSSGGTQAAVVCNESSSLNLPNPIAFQTLFYPATCFVNPDLESYQKYKTGYSLNYDFMVWAWRNYLTADVDVTDPLVSPLTCSDLSKCPPTFLATAEFDPLCSEGETYADQLKNSGVLVNNKRYNGVMHGFVIQFPQLNVGRKCIADWADFILKIVKK